MNLQQGDAVQPSMPAVSRAAGILEQQLPDLRAQLMRHARHAVHDASLAEDLVQETLIVVIQKHHTRRGESTLGTWAVAVLKHKVADWYRSPDRRRLMQLDDSDALADDVDASYDSAGNYREPVAAWQQPDRQAERKQMMQVLDACNACLPERTRRVFIMHEWLGFETREICEQLGVSAENCRVILHRARMALRICMQRDWLGGKPLS